MGGILHAEIQEGPFKGWEIRASMLIQGGRRPAEVKAAMIAEAEAKIEDLRALIEHYKSLPDQIS
jgi:hypothetical protein